MPIINNKNNLPKWFDLNSYKKCASFSDNDLHLQVKLRRRIINCISSNIDNLNDSLLAGSEYSHWQQIESGDIELKIIICQRKIFIGQNNADTIFDSSKYTFPLYFIDEKLRALNNSPSISTNTPSDMLSTVQKMKSAGVFDNINFTADGRISFNSDASMGDVNLVKQKYNLPSKTINIDINLAENTNTEILSQLKGLLPQWRIDLNMPESELIDIAKPAHSAKIRSYNILALLDLMAWEKINGTKISHSVYAVALFPNGERGDTELKQTILPFAKRLLSENYRQLIA